MSNERDELTTLILGRTATRAAEAVLAAGYRKPEKVEWGIFRANDPIQSHPCDNLTYKTREGAELARTTQFLAPEFWEVRGRSVAQWNKQEVSK